MRGRAGHVVRWRDQRGKNRQRTFDRADDARDFDTEIRRAKRRGVLSVAQVVAEGITVDEWRATRWQREHAPLLEASTIRTYDGVWKRHIAGGHRIAELPVTQITAEILRDWQASLRESGVGVETIRKARTALGSVLRHAAESGAIAANPMAVVRPPKRQDSKVVRPLAPQAVEAVRRAMLGDDEPTTQALRDAAILSLLAYAGLRPGELRALRWEDVRTATLLIESARDDQGREKPTKTRRAGTVQLLRPVSDDLDALRARTRPRPRDLVLGCAWTKDDWDAWRRTSWAPALRAAGLEVIPRPYTLRHSFASLLIAEHRSVNYVAAQLRHTPAMTLRVYAHLFDEYADGQPIVAVDEIDRYRQAT